MDRNTVIGFSLIFLILAGYYWYTAPTPEQIQMQRTQDSLARGQQQMSKDSFSRLSGENLNDTNVVADVESSEILRKSKNLINATKIACEIYQKSQLL